MWCDVQYTKKKNKPNHRFWMNKNDEVKKGAKTDAGGKCCVFSNLFKKNYVYISVNSTLLLVLCTTGLMHFYKI